MRFSRIWRYASNSRHFDEEGFTLIELTISIVILVIVIGAITLALMTVLMLSGSASKSISDSSDAQVVSASLTTDIQSAVEITTSAAMPAEQCGTGTQLLGLEWDRLGPWEGTWTSTKTYGKNATVQYGGSAYLSLVASNRQHTPTATSSYWSLRAYNTVVSYLAVQQRSTWELIRDECTSGYSPSPSDSEPISSDICEPVQGCTQHPQQAPAVTITPSTKAGTAATGWASAAGVNGVALKVFEPQTHYAYTLEADPAAGTAPSGTTTVVSASTGCGYATPGTGTYAQDLCFVNFATYTYTKAAYQNGKCQTITEAITGTPFKLSFCLSVQAGTESNDEAPPTGWSSACGDAKGYLSTSGVREPTKAPASPCADPSSADVVAVPFPTYAQPPRSESFVGNNGFYTGVPGDAALYEYLEGTAATLYFTKIKVVGPNGPATSWELITGDAESTDPGESLTWSTCPAQAGGVQSNPSTCNGLSTPPKFSLIANNPSTPGDYYGNDCMNTKYTNTVASWLRYGALAPNDSFAGATGALVFKPTVRTQAQEVECAAGVTSDKTGAVMLEAPEPSDLTVNMVGSGLQGMFLGFLL